MSKQQTHRAMESERVIFGHFVHGKALQYIPLQMEQSPMKALINNDYKELLRAIDEDDSAKVYLAATNLCATVTHYACEFGERQKLTNPTEGR